ncbi:hypothetical protein CCMSSC00406_0003493 [Pleurotus cornucopiae]|uniref:Uncharacterized protein n=1 Tax=Pleurotus cornucopiae TaxID=5321 RepID=A0ACB7J9U4_PLECO|nr:hypothetical protein CCMSSC00406_0003493 [Pleurotus cornucopiae]
MFSSALVILALSASALANVFITSPTASTTFTGGKEATISWQDTTDAPSLKDFGLATVSIYAGNAIQQTSLQLIVDNVDVSTTSSIKFTPNPQIGPNSDQYFVRIESRNLKDAAQPQFPALAFSAKFKMDGMTGTFSPAVQAQIAGQSTAPLAGSTPAATGAPAATSAAASTTKSGSSTRAATSTGSAQAATQTDGAIALGSSAKILFAVVVAVAVALC